MTADHAKSSQAGSDRYSAPFPSPFSPNVAFCMGHVSEWGHGALHDQERALLSPQATHKRVEQFTLGRTLARQALGAFLPGQAPALCILRLECGRAPAWPEGFVGSITHAGPWGAAAVARNQQYSGVGVDLESVQPISQAFRRRLLRESEREGLADLEETMALVVVFSAKESVYKAIHPAGRIPLGFLDVETAFQPLGAGRGEFSWRLISDGGTGFPPGFSGRGVYQWRPGLVLTGTWILAEGKSEGERSTPAPNR
ncbi:MAG: 4'-phosphopantetheinyl transferase superfamily protein [Deltaproteobacteria bacterium]|nr:4'-phosphopantetheinyl transferase superfamily protein [Deltaproteobacteria bacterium]